MPNDNHQPATKQDLIEPRVHVDQRIDQLRADLIERLGELQTFLRDPAWARPLQVRLRAMAQIDERLTLIEERVRDIEFTRLSRRLDPVS